MFFEFLHMIANEGHQPIFQQWIKAVTQTNIDLVDRISYRELLDRKDYLGAEGWTEIYKPWVVSNYPLISTSHWMGYLDASKNTVGHILGLPYTDSKKSNVI